MLCPRFSATLLLAATCVFLKAGGLTAVGVSITCEGNVARLNCDGGKVITVLSAFYGRTDRTTCSVGHRAYKVRNTHCSTPARTMSTICDGRNTCAIKATNSEFGDPCRKTYKYLYVVYKCEFGLKTRSVTCEGDKGHLYCGVGQVIKVLSAVYGRSDRYTCAVGQPKSKTYNTGCASSDSKVADICNGQDTCAINATNAMFGDPCRGTSKYLDVVYKCIGQGL